MNSFLEKYIISTIFDHIESIGGTFYPTRESFLYEVKREISRSHQKIDKYDIKILFTCMGEKEFMNIALIGPLSTSFYDLLIPSKVVERESKLNYLLESE